jgi:hypothetical protein
VARAASTARVAEVAEARAEVAEARAEVAEARAEVAEARAEVAEARAEVAEARGRVASRAAARPSPNPSGHRRRSQLRRNPGIRSRRPDQTPAPRSRLAGYLARIVTRLERTTAAKRLPDSPAKPPRVATVEISPAVEGAATGSRTQAPGDAGAEGDARAEEEAGAADAVDAEARSVSSSSCS